jgi:hypothetical protein
MGNFSTSFGADLPYGGAGLALPSTFFAHFPPEVGCVGFSGIDEDLIVQGRISNFARQMLARSITDHTSFIIDQFSVGTSGYDPAYPVRSVFVDPTLQTLVSEVYRGPVTAIESPLMSGVATAFVCRLGRDTVQGGLGEIALWARISWSPFPSEIGSYFLFAAVHHPMNSKTMNHVATSRVVIVF